MDSVLFLEQFGHLAYSPDGVSKIRSMILDLAVRGKLVEQNPDDEPASELIKRIDAEKKRLVKTGEIKKPKKLSKISETEKAYNLPRQWLWVRLGEITNYGNTEKIEPEETTDPELWVLDLQDIEKITSKILQKVRLKDREFQSSKNLFHEGDILYGKLRPYLDKVVVADEMGVTTTEIIPFNSFGCVNPYYLRWFMKSSGFIHYANNSTHGMNLPRLSTQNAQLAVISLPPLAEQKRIIAKVDELMALCDQLEAEQVHQCQLVERSVKSTFHHLANAPTKSEAHQYWGYAEKHFSTLFDRITTIKDLRATILQLAVQGRLVPQNPDDEPASELLKQIDAEKKRLVKAGEIKKPKKLPKIKQEDILYRIPEHWEWTRLGAVTSYGNTDKVEPEEGNDPELWVLDLQDIEKITSKLLQKVRSKDRDFQSTKNVFYAGDVLYGKLRPYLDKVIVADEMGITTTEIIPFNGFGCINPHYIRCYMKSPEFIRYANNSTHGMNLPRLSTKNAQLAMFALPPLAEQKRIVAKVDELMALCDQLEQEVEQSQYLSGRLFDSIIHHLFN